MKKCPYCGAVIEENARFCLYCMKELEEKAVMEKKTPFWTKQKIRLILICAGAVLLLIVILLLISRCAVPEQTGGPGGSSPDATQTQTDPTDDILAESTGTASEGTPGETAAADTGNTETPGSSPNTPTLGTDTAPGSATPTPSASPGTQTPSEVVYIYEDADMYNLLPMAISIVDQYLAQNAIIITGVETPSENGVYIIPEQIDGRKVAKVHPDTFCEPEICSTVKKIVFPASIDWILLRVNSCINLTDLYFAAETLHLDDNLIWLFPNRQQLTVHAAPDCDMYYIPADAYVGSLKKRMTNRGIAFQSWDGIIDFEG